MSMNLDQRQADFIARATRFLSRRHFLQEGATGLGAIALAWMLREETTATEDRPADDRSTDNSESENAALHGLPHFEPRAKRVINIFCPGGVSHVDTFDYKPELARLDGMPLEGKGTLDPFFGRPGNLRKSYYAFHPRGESGLWVSDLFPHLAEKADDLTMIHSMVTKSSSHTPAAFQMNTGFTQNGFPSLGAWLSYGLGSMNRELPTFVVLPDPRGLPHGGSNNWNQGFLPAQHQGTAFRTEGDEPIPNLHTPAGIAPDARQSSLELLARLNRDFAYQHPGDSELTARLESYELAARMQMSIPEVADFADETAATQSSYGLDDPRTAGFGRNCLLARRLLERGVRFVQLFNGGALGSPRINWDAHEDLVENHSKQAATLDQPCAALLADLKQRGLLDDTLVVWSTEFGRTPFTEVKGEGLGRDHHPLVFTCWMAGAGLKPGMAYGASDEVGYLPADNPVTVYDFHATILHLLGVDHTRLTYYHNGLQRRLTDVHGEVIRGILS